MSKAISRRDVWITAEDGTGLYALDCGPAGSSRIPVLCLSGLTRNHRDFEPVIAAFGGEHRIIAPDYRGRGKSEFAKDPKSYRPDIELQDVLALLAHLQVPRVVVIGTSRGGLVGMLFANVAPEKIAGLMLVDIGPMLEPAGLRRIAAYVGEPQLFSSWDEAAKSLADSSVGFKNVTLEQWTTVAKRIYGERNSHPCSEHDPQLAVTFPKPADINDDMPNLWKLIPALQALNCGLIYGDGSDLISVNTIHQMQLALPGLGVTCIPDRGHVPFLDEPASLQAIAKWISATHF